MLIEINGITIDTKNHPVTLLEGNTPLDQSTPDMTEADMLELLATVQKVKEKKPVALDFIADKLLPFAWSVFTKGKASPVFALVEKAYPFLVDLFDRDDEPEERNSFDDVMEIQNFLAKNPEIEDELDGLDLSNLRRNRVDFKYLIKAPVNVTITNNDRNGMTWMLPDGFKKGKHGFMQLGFNGRRFLKGTEEHWSRGSADGRFVKKTDEEITHAMIVWVNTEGRGDEVYGRSALVEVD